MQAAHARCLLPLLVAAAVAQAATVVKTNKEGDSMPWAKISDDRSKSGYYEPFGQAPIAVAHSLQLPCGNKFLMMVSDSSSRRDCYAKLEKKQFEGPEVSGV